MNTVTVYVPIILYGGVEKNKMDEQNLIKCLKRSPFKEVYKDYVFTFGWPGHVVTVGGCRYTFSEKEMGVIANHGWEIPDFIRSRSKHMADDLI